MDEKILIPLFALPIILLIFLSESLWPLIFYIGLYRYLTVVWEMVMVVKRNFITKRLGLLKRYGQGSYVLVTGGANGIGFEFSKQLAAQGFNLVILDFDKSALDKAEKVIKEQFKEVKVKTVIWDLSKLDSVDDYRQVLNQLQDLDISILVNNAGMVDYIPFAETQSSRITSIFKVNTFHGIIFSSLFIPLLKTREAKSAIINVSSLTALAPQKFMITYSSLKTLTRYFSITLSEELGSKIDVLCWTPGKIITNMTNNKPDADAITPDILVNNTLNSLGQNTEMSGYWLHDYSTIFIESLWQWNHTFYEWVLAKMFTEKDFEDYRKGQRGKGVCKQV